MIDVSDLSKSYGSVRAVRNVSFHVDPGEVVGFLGPNGAGKSTTLRILAGFLGMSAGRVQINGHDIVDASTQARASIGYMAESVPLYGEMRVEEYLSFRAELKDVPRRQRKAAVGRAMDEARVTSLSDTLIGHLSKGYRQRVGLADALVARPPVLILDEPTAGLDPNQIREVRALVRDLAARHTVLLSTHVLSEVEATCSRALVIAQGKLVGAGTLDDLRSRRRSTRARLVIRADHEEAEEAATRLRLLTSTKNVTTNADPDPARRELLVVWKNETIDPAAALEEAVRVLVEGGVGVSEVTPVRASLDEVFAQLTEERPENLTEDPA